MAKSGGLHARLINKIPFSLMSEIAYLIGVADHSLSSNPSKGNPDHCILGSTS
ncbi:hypothetical protein EMEDMD4_960028 [Sinorhizobium medicae]|uniref:Uncharacterized protein n=1 Tax=Sinorhizobium medicae TaxID=110321 RepID=A0A508X8L8_9HYPH|nr:hypothetical protein EMEDMD4_960028 [Sinorhizobium medicae]